MTEQRRGQMRVIGAMLPRVAGPGLGKNGLGEAQLIRHWPDIVGERIARGTVPEKLSFFRGERRDGTLRLGVVPGLALEIQHNEPVILERINAFLGYRAVTRLTLRQTLTSRRAPAPRPPRLEPDAEAALDRRVAVIGGGELRAALKRLGAALATSERK
jgi:hypothetical protein